MKPKSASLCVLNGVFTNTDYHTWIGPSLFDIWGKPKLKKLSTCTIAESQEIGKLAEEIYSKLKEQ